MTQPNEYHQRLKRLKASLQPETSSKETYDALIIASTPNLYYFSGMRCTRGYLLVWKEGAYFLTDTRYFESAQETVHHCKVKLLDSLADAITAWIKEIGPTHIGFEGRNSWNEWELMRKATENVNQSIQWHEAGELIESFRRIKSPSEIELIAESARLNDLVFKISTESIRSGMTEIELSQTIQAQANLAGAQSLSFDTIVASGPMTSRPHHSPSMRQFTQNDLIMIDMGLCVGNYCSDMTRMLKLGNTSAPLFTKLYDAVHEAQFTALHAVKPGIHCQELNAIASDVIRKHGFGDALAHGLGHGVGLEIHEAPTLSQRSEDILEAGMVITIEPGAYLAGTVGIRIEDLVVVEPHGYRILSQTPKTLMIL